MTIYTYILPPSICLKCPQIFDMSRYIINKVCAYIALMEFSSHKSKWMEYLSMKTHISLSWSSQPILCTPYPCITLFHDISWYYHHTISSIITGGRRWAHTMSFPMFLYPAYIRRGFACPWAPEPRRLLHIGQGPCFFWASNYQRQDHPWMTFYPFVRSHIIRVNQKRKTARTIMTII